MHDVEAIPQVEAKSTGLDLLPQCAVGRGDDADVDAAGDVLTDAPELAVLDDAEYLGLRARGQLADLVQEQRPAVRLFEHAGAVGDRAGKGAARVAEQLGLDEIVG